MKYICSWILVLTLMFGSFELSAQKMESPKVVAYQAGIGGFNLAVTAADSNATTAASLGLVHAVTGDLLIGKRFSMGAMLSFQNSSMSLVDSSDFVLERGNVRQIYAGFRGLWHFGKTERVDVYSGVKLGMRLLSASNIETTKGRKSRIQNRFNRNFMSFGFIPIGVRYFFPNHIGLHLETSLGAPSLASFGINYRF